MSYVEAEVKLEDWGLDAPLGSLAAAHANRIPDPVPTSYAPPPTNNSAVVVPVLGTTTNPVVMGSVVTASVVSTNPVQTIPPPDGSMTSSSKAPNRQLDSRFPADLYVEGSDQKSAPWVDERGHRYVLYGSEAECGCLPGRTLGIDIRPEVKEKENLSCCTQWIVTDVPDPDTSIFESNFFELPAVLQNAFDNDEMIWNKLMSSKYSDQENNLRNVQNSHGAMDGYRTLCCILVTGIPLTPFLGWTCLSLENKVDEDPFQQKMKRWLQHVNSTYLERHGLLVKAFCVGHRDQFGRYNKDKTLAVLTFALNSEETARLKLMNPLQTARKSGHTNRSDNQGPEDPDDPSNCWCLTAHEGRVL